jgi:foldase protein PrsA
LAQQYSDDPGSKSEGGLYADAPVKNWVPEFREAAISLPLNTVSEVVRTDYGYHVIRVEKRSVKTYADVRAQVLQSLVAEKVFDHTDEEIPKLITFKDLK